MLFLIIFYNSYIFYKTFKYYIHKYSDGKITTKEIKFEKNDEIFCKIMAELRYIGDTLYIFTKSKLYIVIYLFAKTKNS